MADQEHFRKLERMYAAAPVNAWFEPRLTVGEGVASVVIAVRRDFFHAAGAVHGSVCFKALDDAAFFAAQSLVEETFVLTSSFNAHFTRPIDAGEMRAEGRVAHRSRRLLVAEAVLLDGDGRQIALGQGSFMPSEMPLGPELGYR